MNAMEHTRRTNTIINKNTYEDDDSSGSDSSSHSSTIFLSPSEPINKTYILFFDGCSKGNPGRAGCGAVIYVMNNEKYKEIWVGSEFVGDLQTNNYAEYRGLLLGLNKAVDMGIKQLIVKGDSILVVRQMMGIYDIFSENLIHCYKKCKELEKLFVTIEYQHIYRTENQRADKLAYQIVRNF
jgi:ribonuclease HI